MQDIEEKVPSSGSNKFLIYAGIGLLVVGLLLVVGFMIKGSSDETEEGSTSQTPVGGRYEEEWNEATFTEHASRQRWVYFHANWCPQCIALNKDIKANLNDIPADVVIFKVDFDDSQALKQRYGVRNQTTVVSVDSDGEKIESFHAAGSEQLSSLIEELYIEPVAGDDNNSESDGDSDITTMDIDEEADSGSSSDQNPDNDSNGDVGSSEDGSEDEQIPADSDVELPPLSPRYVEEWSEAAFTEHASRQRWVYFHANWCPQCIALNKDIKANLDDIPADVVIFKVDFDDSQALKQRYGVRNQTTVVSVDSDGEKIESFHAAGSEQLSRLIEELY